MKKFKKVFAVLLLIFVIFFIMTAFSEVFMTA